MTGTTIGKYRILSRLGTGGMGTVYKALDETLQREVAIKVLNRGLDDARVVDRFRAEATTLAKLNHPAIATIYELFQCSDELLIVMEFVRGETLETLLARLGVLTLEQAIVRRRQSSVGARAYAPPASCTATSSRPTSWSGCRAV
jgi:serine/threonine-protein kinase